MCTIDQLNKKVPENDSKALNQPLANIMTGPGVDVVLTSGSLDYFEVRAQGQGQALFLKKTPDFEVLARACLGCGALLRVWATQSPESGGSPWTEAPGGNSGADWMASESWRCQRTAGLYSVLHLGLRSVCPRVCVCVCVFPVRVFVRPLSGLCAH